MHVHHQGKRDSAMKQQVNGGDSQDRAGQAIAGHWQLNSKAEAKLKELFEALDVDKDLIQSAQERMEGAMLLDQFLFDFGVTADDIAISVGTQNLTLEGFKSAVEREWELSHKEQSLSTLHVQRIMATCIPGGSPEQPLMALESMTREQISHLCRVEIASALEAVLHNHIKAQQSSSAANACSEDGGNAKFAVQTVATFGHMDEYFHGLEGMLGFPMPNLFEAIKQEHCNRDDSRVKFHPGNYTGPGTTPAECVAHVFVCMLAVLWLLMMMLIASICTY
jgi:hypothetical protein